MSFGFDFVPHFLHTNAKVTLFTSKDMVMQHPKPAFKNGRRCFTLSNTNPKGGHTY